jgi:hypothetical protein
LIQCESSSSKCSTEINSEHGKVLVKIGNLFQDIGRWKKAKQSYEMALGECMAIFCVHHPYTKALEEALESETVPDVEAFEGIWEQLHCG